MARLPESAARRGAGAAGVSVVSVSGVVRWLLKQKGAIMRIFLNWGDSETACHVPYCEKLIPVVQYYTVYKHAHSCCL